MLCQIAVPAKMITIGVDTLSYLLADRETMLREITDLRKLLAERAQATMTARVAPNAETLHPPQFIRSSGHAVEVRIREPGQQTIVEIPPTKP